MNAPSLGQLLHSYFEDHLKCQKGLRPSSVRSYRDALALFLCFVAEETRKKLSRLSLEDLTCEQVLRFLDALEEKRHNHIRTRNQRLAVLRTFFEYVVHRTPESLNEAHRIAAIPVKRTPPAEMRFMDREEVQTLFASLPTSGASSLRDRTLLLFLYNSGARVQEVSDLCVKNLELGSMPRVHLHGKGDKWRTCPLWKETAQLLAGLLALRKPVEPDNSVFVSRHGRPLTRFGIYKIVRRLTQGLVNPVKGRPQRRISPHCFRHTTAVHLLESGVEPNVIRGWLGHVGLETTNRYAEITFRMKQKALDACQPPTVNAASLRKTKWRNDTELLEWLKSL
jgi:site-specific recombinase XerD